MLFCVLFVRKTAILHMLAHLIVPAYIYPVCIKHLPKRELQDEIFCKVGQQAIARGAQPDTGPRTVGRRIGRPENEEANISLSLIKHRLGSEY